MRSLVQFQKNEWIKKNLNTYTTIMLFFVDKIVGREKYLCSSHVAVLYVLIPPSIQKTQFSICTHINLYWVAQLRGHVLSISPHKQHKVLLQKNTFFYWFLCSSPFWCMMVESTNNFDILITLKINLTNNIHKNIHERENECFSTISVCILVFNRSQWAVLRLIYRFMLRFMNFTEINFFQFFYSFSFYVYLHSHIVVCW